MRRIIFLLAIMLLVKNSFGQYTHTLPQVTPKSPNSESLGKYGEIPVSLGTGATNISIPLYELKVGNFNLPITLSYNNRGLKVDEIPSWVGLGWDLQVGGVVSLQQNGLNDFDPDYGLLSVSAHLQDLNNYLTGSMTPQQKFNYLERIIQGQEDSQFDMYNYSTPSSNGTFYFSNAQLNVRMIPETDVKVTKLTSGIKITDKEGNQFFYEALEIASVQSSAGVERITPFSGNSSYFLSKIITSENRVILFKYKNYIMSYNQPSTSISHKTSGGSGCPSSVSFGSNFFYKENLLLDSIIADIGYIKFHHHSQGRADINTLSPTAGNLPGLEKITIWNYENTAIKEYEFATSYFSNNARLKLNSVTETNANTMGKKWEFTYFETASLPSFFSNSQDHWGYSNGTGNTTLVPQANYSSFISNWVTNYLPAYADRRSNSTFSTTGMLKKIKYPTGGTTEFEYEANKISVSNLTQITSLSPFLQPDNQAFSIVLADANTFTQHIVSGSFTVTEPTLALASGFTQSEPPGFYQSFIILTGPQNSINQIYQAISPNPPISQGSVVLLEPGNYTYELHDDDYDNGTTIVPIDAQLRIYAAVPATSYTVGGNRVKKITTTDESGINPPMIRKFTYDDGFENIVFRNIPHYYTTSAVYKPEGNVCLFCSAEYVVHDQNVKPGGGYHIEYKNITETFEENNQYGKIEYKFKPSETYYSSISQPYVNPTNTSWRTGIPEIEKVYQKEGANQIVKIQKESNYNISSSPISVNGIKVDYESYCSGYTYAIVNVHRASLVTPYSETFYLNSLVQKHFENSALLQTTDNILSASTFHKQPTQTERTDSKGVKIREYVKYSYDYNTSIITNSEAQGINSLKNKGILIPVEKITTKEIGSLEYVVFASLLTYKPTDGLLDKAYTLKIATPILLSSFLNSSINGSGNFVKDSRYAEDISFNTYDSYSNILSVNETNNVVNSYIWEYNSSYPIAKITDAQPGEVAYTSFEGTGTGNWVVPDIPVSNNTAITGKKAYLFNGSNSMTKSGLNTSSTYIVSYWTTNLSAFNITGTISGYPINGRTVNGWKYFEHKVTGRSAITVGGIGNIDELRLYPEKALMTTYTYDPLIGITAECDANNRILYYRYDALKRLELVIDQDNNILKKICYNYAGQPENCINCTNFMPNWQNTATALRCQQGSCGNTGYQEQEQQDMNPCSPTYNQTQWIVAGYNTAACPLQTCVNLTSTNTAGLSGYTASYYNNTTGITYNLAVPATTGLQSLGTIPTGNYTLTISRTTGYPLYATFKSGCWKQTISGTSAVFYNVGVSTTTCNSITIDLAN